VELDFVSGTLDSARADCSSCAQQTTANENVYPLNSHSGDMTTSSISAMARKLLGVSLDSVTSGDHQNDGISSFAALIGIHPFNLFATISFFVLIALAVVVGVYGTLSLTLYM